MRALVIQPEPDSIPGFVGERLRERGYELVLLIIATDQANPNPAVDFEDPTGYDLIVTMGSAQSVYDRETIGNWIDGLLATLASAQRADVPMLGVCFGAQAIAAALGGSVQAAEEHEVGWYEIETDVPDHLAPGPWMQWHYDRLNAPPAATELARTEQACQAFRIGRTLAVQFHPEVNVETIACWIEMTGPDELATRSIDPATILAESNANEAGSRERCHQLVDWFLDEVVNRSHEEIFQ